MAIVAGLDIGGAHLKVALTERGRVLTVEQIACPLWQGLDRLDAALSAAEPLLKRAGRYAVTMTGELSDLFPSRKAGVETIVAKASGGLGPETLFWMGTLGLGDAAAALEYHAAVGSTNFLATATLVARFHSEALLIDFGSTTADIIPIQSGHPSPSGMTDAARQESGELVYTGLTRTSVMGITQRAPFKGVWTGLAREHLATMADVRRILGTLPGNVDQHATADGRGQTVEESIARFARLFGREAGDGELGDWRHAAGYVREQQLRSIADAALAIAACHGLAPAAPVIAAGIGAGEIEEIARRLNRPYRTFGETLSDDPNLQFWATACAPAVAVALLAG